MEYHSNGNERSESEINFSNFYLESHHRNLALSVFHGRIPSYSLWNDHSISLEKVSERIKWWMNYIDSEDESVKVLSETWVEVLTKKSD